MFISSFLSLVIFLDFTSSRSSLISLCFSKIILLSLNLLLACLACFSFDIFETNEKLGQEVCMVFPAKQSSQSIQVAVLYLQNHLKQFILGFLLVDKSDYLMTYIDIYVCIYVYKHIYLYMHRYIYICHQTIRFVNWQKAQYELYSLVHGSPSTAQLPGYKYIKG